MFATYKYLQIFLLFLYTKSSLQISCKDERNRDVDWYINYKLPKITSEPSGSDLEDGKAYAYITAPGSSTWKLSKNNVKSGSGSMLENTMEEFYSNKRDITYLLYNDDAPGNITTTAVGHLKGVIAFDEDTGFWLIHSIPNFPDKDNYEYPDSALNNGQSILCVTFKTKELNEICNQLLYSHPNVYARAITDEVKQQLDDKAKTLFTDSPAFIRRNPLTRTATIKSLGNKVFTSFAKDNQYKEDLYSNIIAPGLKSSLIVETWRKGSGTILPPSCRSDYTVIDIVSLNMTASFGRQKKNIAFKYTEDHSKWAISDDTNKNYICIADMNRMLSQEKRGGGALCFISSDVVKAFDSIIQEMDQCPT